MEQVTLHFDDGLKIIFLNFWHLFLLRPIFPNKICFFFYFFFSCTVNTFSFTMNINYFYFPFSASKIFRRELVSVVTLAQWSPFSSSVSSCDGAASLSLRARDLSMSPWESDVTIMAPRASHTTLMVVRKRSLKVYIIVYLNQDT